MKKVFLFVAVISAFSFASCKKERTCVCTFTNPITGTKETEDIKLDEKMTKKDAKAECDTGDYAGVSDCELK